MYARNHMTSNVDLVFPYTVFTNKLADTVKHTDVHVGVYMYARECTHTSCMYVHTYATTSMLVSWLHHVF